MKDVSHLIANLSPEKRAELLQRLRSDQEASDQPVSKGENIVKGEPVHDPDYIPDVGDNYYSHLRKPGNFNSIVLRKKEILPPAPEHLQVKVKAASINFRDIMIAMNMYSDTPGVPSVMGSDYSGIVTAVGSKVNDFKVGDHVFFLSAGSLYNNGEMDENSHFAAYMNIKPNQVTKKPSNISWEEAAGIPTVFLTSYFALNYISKLKVGHNVLIHTASGGVGQAAIQIARWIGAKIFVTAGTDRKREYLKSIGFSQPMNSRTTDFAEEILKRTNGKGVDVILNTLAGEAAFKGLSILNTFGHFLQIDKKDIAQNKSLPLGLFKKGLSYSAIDLGHFYLHPELMKKQLDEIAQHYESGNFKPLVTTKFKISELGKALSYLSRAEHIGKVVLEY